MKDIMTILRTKRYRFATEKISQLIDRHGGKQRFALELGCSETTLYRAIRNATHNPRIQKDILSALSVQPEDVGHIDAA